MAHTPPPILVQCLRALREPHERSDAMSKARLAVRIHYNPQTVLHWVSGRRAVGKHGLMALQRLREELKLNTED